MILRNLTLTNFGVFRGEHRFDLSPRASRALILFGGKNGAGKSTLFEAIRLCLYGSKAIGPSSRNSYLDHLNARIHTNSNLLIQPPFSSVSLEFDFAESGEVKTYEICRSWTRQNGSKSPETLELKRDGAPMDDVAAEHWQDFIQDLIPVGISELFFFDGERIQHLAEDSSDNSALDHAVKTLLGLNLVDRLETDLRLYMSKMSRSVNTASGDRLEGLEKDIQSITKSLRLLEEEHSRSLERLEGLKASVDLQEQKIASEGGSFTRDKESLLKRKSELTALIERDEDTIRAFAGELLPFVLVRDLCLELKSQLRSEEEAEQIRSGIRSLTKAKKRFVRYLQSDDMFGGESRLSSKTKEAIRKRILDASVEVFNANEPKIERVHELSMPNRTRILSWIDQATGSLPNKIRDIASELERSYRALHRVENRLRKVPAEETLKPLLEELSKRHHELQKACQHVLESEETIKGKRTAIRELERQRDNEFERVAVAASKMKKLKLVPQISGVLDEYRMELVERKLLKLQKEATACFNRLCRKRDSLRKIGINPKNFTVTLFDGKDRQLKKSELSAGEKQIYAVSMLWALARTSGRPLPMIIDTPLARLDSDHRRLLIREYFPKASHQVIILSTDTEVDEQHFSELQPHVSHAYQLQYDETERSSTVRSGYFWRGENEAH